MPTFTSSVSGSTSGPNGSKSWTVNETDYLNCLDYLVARYTSPRGTVVPTRAQALIMWQQENITQLAARTKQWIDQSQKDQVNNPTPTFT